LITLNASDGRPLVIATLLTPANPNGTVCIAVAGNGRALASTNTEGFKHGVTYLLPHLLLDADEKAKLHVDDTHRSYAGYTWCYNRVLIAERARDLLVAIAAARKIEGTKRVVLWGEGRAGPRALLAAALGRRYLDRVLVDADWDFTDIKSLDDPDMLPGALRYGGLDGFAALVLPVALTIADQKHYSAWPATSAMQGTDEGLSLELRSSLFLSDRFVEQD
jgi:hypothetical protein